MKLWLISQDVNDGWDTYSDAVVAAETEEEARNTHPRSGFYKQHDIELEEDDWTGPYTTWCSPAQVKVELIGEAVEGLERKVVCASFHAG